MGGKQPAADIGAGNAELFAAVPETPLEAAPLADEDLPEEEALEDDRSDKSGDETPTEKSAAADNSNRGGGNSAGSAMWSWFTGTSASK